MISKNRTLEGKIGNQWGGSKIVKNRRTSFMDIPLDKLKAKSLQSVKKTKIGPYTKEHLSSQYLNSKDSTFRILITYFDVTHQSLGNKMTSFIYYFILLSILINSIKARNCEDIILEGCHSCGPCDTLFELEAENAADCQEKCTFLRLSRKYCKYFEFFENKVPTLS